MNDARERESCCANFSTRSISGGSKRIGIGCESEFFGCRVTGAIVVIRYDLYTSHGNDVNIVRKTALVK